MKKKRSAQNEGEMINLEKLPCRNTDRYFVCMEMMNQA
jgi:hypothetical protein